ncbi:beta-lactamase/transpeptidase-like protein [Xylariomycetidae sp. FL2044]|nr:beta-lactamase/transpeptidase-like protein [Xylariomycetidae sp. FL2044]
MIMTSSLDDQLQAAVVDGTAPGIVIFAKDKDGHLDIAKAFSSPDATHPYDLDTVMELTSASKLPTSIAGLQLVERGLVTLDQDLSPLLPSLARQGILVSIDDDVDDDDDDDRNDDENGKSSSSGKVKVKKVKKLKVEVRLRRNPITLRRLLTHSAGCGYPFAHAGLARIREASSQQEQQEQEQEQEPSSSDNNTDADETTVVVVDKALADLPLLFEPGEGWAYGTGLDRVGQVVEALTGGSLEKWMREHIWGPLGVGSSTTFFPDKDEGIKKKKKVPMAYRKDEDPEAEAVEDVDGKVKTVGMGLKVSV